MNAISNEEWRKQQGHSIKHAHQYRYKNDWKKLYREHLRDFFGIGCRFPDCTVLDVGCGPRGIISVVEAKRKVGVDPSISAYREVFSDMETDVEYINSKAEEIPLSDSCAEVIFCTNTLNHVQDPEKVLAEIARILKPNGRLYFDVHDNPRGVGHPHVFTRDGLLKMLKKHFKVEKMFEWNQIPSISTDRVKVGSKIVEKKRIYMSKTKVWGAVCLSLKSSR